AVIIGLLMHFIFRHEKTEEEGPVLIEGSTAGRPLWQTVIYFALMIAILVFANWGKPVEESGFWYSVYTLKWTLTAVSALGLAVVLGLWFKLRWLRLALAAAPAVLLGIFTPASP